MGKRAHNSQFPKEIRFNGGTFSGPVELYKNAVPRPAVGLATFSGRLSRHRKRGGVISDDFIDTALYLSPDAFRRRHGARQTWVVVDNERINLLDYYQNRGNYSVISYSTFWSRVKNAQKTESLDREKFEHALGMETRDWIAFYGGGRHRVFSYEGDEYPEHAGKQFHSIAAFLITIGRSAERGLVWGRLKSGWDLDNALTVPLSRTEGGGLIYKIDRLSNGQIYVGLTNGTCETRWALHLQSVKKGAMNRLACAIREDGPAGFEIQVIEDGIESDAELKRREIYWIEKLNARGKGGLNTAPGGGLGGLYGKKVTYEGEEFPTMKIAGKTLGARLQLNPWIVETRLRAGEPLPKSVRVHSHHQDTGNNLFRRWKGMLKRNPEQISEEWMDYDAFKAAVEPTRRRDMDLVRPDPHAPWGPENFKWVTSQERVELVHGKVFRINGVDFPSIEAIAREFGIGTSTLKDRIRRQGMTIEEAVSKLPSAKLRKREVIINGQVFSSINQASKHLSEKLGITSGKARYQIQRGDFNR